MVLYSLAAWEARIVAIHKNTDMAAASESMAIPDFFLSFVICSTAIRQILPAGLT